MQPPTPPPRRATFSPNKIQLFSSSDSDDVRIEVNKMITVLCDSMYWCFVKRLDL